MANDIFDKIITSVPANATASRVMSRGEHWEPEEQMPPGLKHWKSPPPMRVYEIRTAHSAASDLTGKKFGRFTVLGLWTETASDGARWICRCACGDYEGRSTKTIKSAMAGLAPEDSLSFQCYYCYAWKAVQRRYKKKGAKPISSFINPAKRALKNQTPEVLIAEEIGDYELAVRIVSKLNKSGFRIVRGDKSGIVSAHSSTTCVPSEIVEGSQS